MKSSSSNASVRGMTKEGELQFYNQRVDEVLMQVNQLEQRVQEVEEFYASKKKNYPRPTALVIKKDKDKEGRRSIVSSSSTSSTSINKQQDAAVSSLRMEELIRQYGTILDQLFWHEDAWPFRAPVEVESLGLYDYYEVIENPMDLGTIKRNMEVGKYKNVHEICADVRLVFNNAMTYNDATNTVHGMAKTLLSEFEKKWLVLLPKITKEEKNLEEAAYGKMAKGVSNDLSQIDKQLDELRNLVIQRCCRRMMSTEEKRQLGTALIQMSMEDLEKAIDIVAQSNPAGFQPDAEQVDLDMDALSETTLWRLRIFVKNTLQNQVKPVISSEGGGCKDNNLKRKRDICNALVKTAKRRSKK